MRYHHIMSTLQDIEKAVEGLSTVDLEMFRAWFAARDAVVWDAQFESDVSGSKLDAFVDEALEDFRSGRSTEL